MNLIGFRYLSGISQVFGAKTRIAIITYHSLCDKPHEYGISPQAFFDQICFIRSHYTVIKLKDILWALRCHDSRPRVVITFDDAYTDFVEHAFPVLQKFSVPCSVFVPTGYIDKCNQWDSQSQNLAGSRIMSEGQIRSLSKSGLVDFGSHSVHHLSMKHLSVEAMTQEAVDSKTCLESLLGQSIHIFSYPYGQLDDFSENTTKVLAEAGYDIAVTTHWGTLQSPKDLLRLRRIFLRENDGSEDLKDKIEGRYDWIALKERLGFGLRTIQRKLHAAISS